MVAKTSHECIGMDSNRYRIIYIDNDRYRKNGWYLKKREYDYYWLKWTDCTMFEISFCPFCGKELINEE